MQALYITAVDRSPLLIPLDEYDGLIMRIKSPELKLRRLFNWKGRYNQFHYDMRSAADRLEISVTALRRFCEEGYLKVTMVKGKKVIYAGDFVKFLEAQIRVMKKIRTNGEK